MFYFFVFNTYDPQIYYNFTFHLGMNLSSPPTFLFPMTIDDNSRCSTSIGYYYYYYYYYLVKDLVANFKISLFH